MVIGENLRKYMPRLENCVGSLSGMQGLQGPSSAAGYMGGSTWGVQEQGTGPHTAYEPHHTLAQSLAWPAPEPGLGCPEAPAQSFNQPSDAHSPFLHQVLLCMASRLLCCLHKAQNKVTLLHFLCPRAVEHISMGRPCMTEACKSRAAR